MKLTLLDMVQDIANDLDTDYVNSITDTTESVQIAQIIKTSFFELLTRLDWEHLKKIRGLDNVSDNDRPNYLKIPTDVTRMDWINYDSSEVSDERKRYRLVEYIYPDEFLARANRLNSDQENTIEVVDFGGASYLIKNNQTPQYWTSFDGEYVAFDAYKTTSSTTLLGSRSQALCYCSPTWSMEDTFVPDLPVEAFPALLAEAKSVAMVKLAQKEDAKAEQQSRRQYRMLSQRGWKAKGGIRYPNYGRRPSKMYSSNNNPLLDKGR